MKGVRQINGFERARRRADLTQMEVANAMHVSQGTVSGWEAGKSYPTGSKLAALAKLYNCTIDQLFERGEESA